MITAPHDTQEIVDAINTMYEWHGGGGSAFYSFASCLMLHNEKHRQQCLDELKIVRYHAETLRDLSELAKVESLIHYATIGVPVCTRNEWLGS